MIILSDKLSLNYTGKVPKDYDVSQMGYTFDFIYLVLKRGASIDKAIEGVANEYGLPYGNLRQYLIDNKFILYKSNKDEVSNLLKQYNTKALKKILKKHGLRTSGKREHIEERIIANRLIAINTKDYYLSFKSRIFYKNKKRRMNIFNNFLYDYYYFDEFNEFYMNNYRKKIDKIPVEFINRHITKALDDKNHMNYVNNNQILADLYYGREHYKKMLENVLKIFCINLNPVWDVGDLKNHEGFSLKTYNDLIYLKEKLGKNRIISAYYVVWDSFNFEKIIISKYMGYRYLKDVLNLKNYQRIIDNLQDNFYLNDDLKIKKITQKTLFDF